jgi:hypothetical protein
MSEEKLYQIFISSTFDDLRDARREVTRTITELGHIPAGMEVFPATDEEQLAFIRRIIDDCDYYLLIIGNRYGSIAPDGVSYTEKEFDYAIKRGLRVLVFPHEDPESLPAKDSERDPDAQKKLRAFREKAKENRLVTSWKTPEELSTKVAISLPKTIKTFPAVGWVRANRVGSIETLSELNELRKKAADLENELNQLREKNSSEPLIQNRRELFPGHFVRELFPGHLVRFGQRPSATRRSQVFGSGKGRRQMCQAVLAALICFLWGLFVSFLSFKADRLTILSRTTTRDFDAA